MIIIYIIKRKFCNWTEDNLQQDHAQYVIRLT